MAWLIFPDARELLHVEERIKRELLEARSAAG